jgi:hypothetical protein
MRHHPVRVGAPRDILPPPSHDTDTAPALLQRNDDNFVEATLEELRNSIGRAGLRQKLARTRNASQVLKLFQPVQRQFHLALIEAWCDTAGLPRIDPARVDSAGLVLRRIRRDASGHFLEGWVKGSGRLRGWTRVQQSAERAAPLSAHRLIRRPVSPSIDRELLRFALEPEAALLDEHVGPLFMAPPDVCVEARKTLFYGLVPTSSADIADVPVDPAQALGGDFGPASPAFRAHLVDPLRGQPMTFVLAGEAVHPDWFEAVEMPGDQKPQNLPLNHWNTLTSTSGAAGMRRFMLLLRQLASEFDAFGETSEARAVFTELETIRLPLVLRAFEVVPRTVAAGTFLRQANRVLLERDPGASRPEMPMSWPALDTAARTRLANALSQAVARRFADTKRQPGRFDEPGAQYVIRAFVRLRPEGTCPARTEWSAYSEPFVIAPWYEGAGAPPVQIALPDVTDRNLLRSLKPNVAFELPPALQNLLSSSPKDLLEGKKGSDPGFTIGWICSFSLPIITICAFICLNIFLSLFDLIFRWMFFIKICIPFPKRSEG